MANDVAEIILDKVKEMNDAEKENHKKRFIEIALDNHYNVCVELISRGTPEDAAAHPHFINKHTHFGCRSFYVVDGDVFITMDDVFKPKKFVNLTKNHAKVFNSIVHHFTNFTTNYKEDPSSICLRLSLTRPIYTQKGGKNWYFRYWDPVEHLDYEPFTPIQDILTDALNLISSVEQHS